MVSSSILLEHLFALVLLWAVVALSGFALLPILRLRLGFASVPFLGALYWTVALYCFPFAHGLDIAAVLALVLAIGHAVRWWRAGALRPVWTRPSWSMLILLVASSTFTTTLLVHYVPLGMDASMYATAATMIARAGGLPSSYAPIAPDLAFAPINLGLPALSGVAIRAGGEPAAVLLAGHHLTFTLLILGVYLVVRTWIGRTPAAVISVASVWLARASQSTIEWGGFPTVLSVAVGLFAARLLLEHGRARSWRLALATGAACASIPLIHGVGGGTWLYCVAPWIVLAAILRTEQRWATLRMLTMSGMTAFAFLLIYRAAGSVSVEPGDLAWTRHWQQATLQLGDGWLGVLNLIRKDAGSFIVLAGWSALGVLVIRRQWQAAILLSVSWLALAVVVLNVRWWILPGSFLLYPERALYWAAPLSAVSLALAWRALPVAWQRVRPATSAVAIVLLASAAYSHNHLYQKIVRNDYVNADGWEALVWARSNLRAERDFVYAPYNSTGAFLPAVAHVGCTGSHHHHFLIREVRAAQARRTVTHALVDQQRTPQADVPAGTVVFRNHTITIVELSPLRAATNGSVPQRSED